MNQILNQLLLYVCIFSQGFDMSDYDILHVG